MKYFSGVLCLHNHHWKLHLIQFHPVMKKLHLQGVRKLIHVCQTKLIILLLISRDEMNHSAKPTSGYSTERITSFELVGEAIEAQDDWSVIGSKKRKLFHQCPETGLVAKMQPRDLFQSNNSTTSSVPTHTSTDLSCDDDFFENIDLDALEAQAIELLKNKPKANELPACNPVSFPSFDLGL